MNTGLLVSAFLTILINGLPLHQLAQTSSNSGQLLYNGIQLPSTWPPRFEIPSAPEDMPVPYLKDVPDVILVSVGRQLFVDDFLIGTMTLRRNFHYPSYHKANPILEPEEKWEFTGTGYPYAAPFSDGVWYDEQSKLFKMWYSTGGGQYNVAEKRFNAVTAYAESKDGIKWYKPLSDVVPGTNLVDTSTRDSNTMWLDKSETDPKKRYKLFNVENEGRDGRWRYVLKYSADGIHWSSGVAQSGDIYDRSTAFYNPFRNKWVLSMRTSTDVGRSRNYLEHSDPEIAVSLAHRAFNSHTDRNNVFWFGPWKNELRHPNPNFRNIQPAIYNHDAIAYESLLLGFFSVWQGPENEVCDSLNLQKRNEIAIGFSRDGFHWDRPAMHRFHPVNEAKDAWNFGNIQSVNGVPLIVGDSLYFYMSGRRLNNFFWDSYSSTGLATMRRDGFASLDAGKSEAHITTRKLVFDGEYLFINANSAKGKLLVEVLDQNDNPVPGFSKMDFIPIQTNATKVSARWKGNQSLSSLKDRPIKLKFYLINGSIYSFWISKYKTGESEGFTSGGGPGLHPSGRDLPIQN